MNETNGKKDYKQRFFREGTSYFEDFEIIVSQLVMVQDKSSQYLVPVLLDLIRGIHDHLAHCQATLGKTETLVEEARARQESPEEIEKIVSVCRELQMMQINLAQSTEEAVNKVLDKVLPR